MIMMIDDDDDAVATDRNDSHCETSTDMGSLSRTRKR